MDLRTGGLGGRATWQLVLACQCEIHFHHRTDAFTSTGFWCLLLLLLLPGTYCCTYTSFDSISKRTKNLPYVEFICIRSARVRSRLARFYNIFQVSFFCNASGQGQTSSAHLPTNFRPVNYPTYTSLVALMFLPHYITTSAHPPPPSQLLPSLPKAIHTHTHTLIFPTS